MRGGGEARSAASAGAAVSIFSWRVFEPRSFPVRFGNDQKWSEESHGPCESFALSVVLTSRLVSNQFQDSMRNSSNRFSRLKRRAALGPRGFQALAAALVALAASAPLHARKKHRALSFFLLFLFFGPKSRARVSAGLSASLEMRRRLPSLVVSPQAAAAARISRRTSPSSWAPSRTTALSSPHSSGTTSPNSRPRVQLSSALSSH